MAFKEALGRAKEATVNVFKDFGNGIKEVFAGKSDPNNIYQLNGRVPLSRAIPFGLQHIFAMFAANITPILLVFAFIGFQSKEPNLAVQTMMGALFLAGFGTIIQLFLGARLPIVIGTSFTYVPVFMTIASTVLNGGGTAADVYYTILGASLVGGLIVAFLSIFYKWWSKILKPIVPAVVVLAIGFSLLQSGATNFFGGAGILGEIETANPPYWAYLLVSIATLLFALAWQLFAKGVWKHVNIIVAIVFGYIIACCIPGMIDFESMKITGVTGPQGVFGSPMFIDFSKLIFDPMAILMTTICYLASTVEGIGDASSLAEMGTGRKATTREISGCLFVDGLNSAFGSLIGAFPQTTYSENVGLVAQTKITNRFTLMIGALFLIVASFFPPVANFIYSIPEAVIGGTTVVIFGSIAVIGMKMVGEQGFTEKNTIILCLSVCLGFGTSYALDVTNAFNKVGLQYLSAILSNCIINMFVISFVLSWVLPDSMDIPLFKKKKPETEGEEKQ